MEKAPMCWNGCLDKKRGPPEYEGKRVTLPLFENLKFTQLYLDGGTDVFTDCEVQFFWPGSTNNAVECRYLKSIVMRALQVQP